MSNGKLKSVKRGTLDMTAVDAHYAPVGTVVCKWCGGLIRAALSRFGCPHCLGGVKIGNAKIEEQP